MRFGGLVMSMTCPSEAQRGRSPRSSGRTGRETAVFNCIAATVQRGMLALRQRGGRPSAGAPVGHEIARKAGSRAFQNAPVLG
jgi:hypothetical protein